MHRSPLGHDTRHLTQESQSDTTSNRIVAVNDLKDTAYEFVHVDDLVQVALYRNEEQYLL